MAVKTLMAILTAGLLLAGCCSLPQRCDTSPCWYDESKGPGVPYYDPNEPDPAKRTYYLGKDPTNLSRVIRLYAASDYSVPNPYVYQPGSESWVALYRWSTIRPYVLPKHPHR